MTQQARPTGQSWPSQRQRAEDQHQADARDDQRDGEGQQQVDLDRRSRSGGGSGRAPAPASVPAGIATSVQTSRDLERAPEGRRGTSGSSSSAAYQRRRKPCGGKAMMLPAVNEAPSDRPASAAPGRPGRAATTRQQHARQDRRASSRRSSPRLDVAQRAERRTRRADADDQRAEQRQHACASAAPRPASPSWKKRVVDGVGDEVVAAAAHDLGHGEVGEGEREHDDRRRATSPGRASGRTTWRKVGERLRAEARRGELDLLRASAVSAGASISTAKGSMYWTSPISTPG